MSKSNPMSGPYIPPARLKMMQAAITDKKSAEYQRMVWEALKKSINGLVNKVNIPNISQVKMIIKYRDKGVQFVINLLN
jgi:hypothetical protein